MFCFKSLKIEISGNNNNFKGSKVPDVTEILLKVLKALSFEVAFLSGS